MKNSELTGKRVTLIRMEDPYTTLRAGAKGTITGEDGIGNILVNWDAGSTLSLIPDVDEYEIQEVEILESRLMKFKMFKESLTEWGLDYVRTKCQELVDLFKDEYNVMVNVHVLGDEVKFNVGLDDDVFLFAINLEREMLYKSVSYGHEGSPEDVHKEQEWSFESTDEAFEILEKELHKILRISEKVSQKYKGGLPTRIKSRKSTLTESYQKMFGK